MFGARGCQVLRNPEDGVGRACQTLPKTSRALRLTAAVTHEGDWYVARCLQAEVTSQGETIEEALANLREALELYFEDVPAPEVTGDLSAAGAYGPPSPHAWCIASA